MSQNRPQTFTPIPSGTNVRVTKADGTEIDGVFRRYLANSTLVMSTPINEDNPALQSTLYIDDYIEVETPIPSQAIMQLENEFLGESVEVFYDSANAGTGALPSPVAGTLVGINSNTGHIVLSHVDGDVYFKDYYYIGPGSGGLVPPNPGEG